MDEIVKKQQISLLNRIMNSIFFLNSKGEPRQNLILDILHELVILFNLFITGFSCNSV